MPDYLPWTDAELSNVERALKRYRALGLEASADVRRCAQGLVVLTRVDAASANAPVIFFELHKLRRNDRAVSAHWVVQIQTVQDDILQRRGCVAANSVVFAIAKAEKDVEDGFAATDSFDIAANAYWLKL